MIAFAMVALLALQEGPQIKTVATPEDAAQWVLADLASLPVEDRKHQFYVWVPPWGDASWHHASTYAMNLSASRSRVIQRPHVAANGWLQRWDLRQLVVDAPEGARIISVLEEIAASDPYFYDQQTGRLHDSIRLGLFGLETIHPDGQLQVVRADRFVKMTLSSIEGGRYLDLRGLRSFPEDLATTQEQHVLARFALFESTSESVDGDRRVGMFRSDVTGKARSVIAISGNGFNIAWLTEDIFDEDVSPTTHPLYNLLENDIRGKEIIWQLPNGLHGFMISDDQGRVLTEAPPQLVTDHQVPRPHTARLQGGAISCIRCHASESGLRSCRNDVARLLAGPLRVLGDSSLDLTESAADEIAARYSGRVFETSLRRGREDYEAAVDQLTGGEMTVEELGNLTSDIYGGHVYPDVDTTAALRQLGIEAANPFESPEAIFREFVTVDSPIEDPTIAALYQGIPVRPSDFERAYGSLLNRSSHWRLSR